MLGARPRLGKQFLSRSRLLEQLPDEPGHVVWLHAPYGYGKSILAAQWAEQLEFLGWRVLWLSAAGNEVKALVVQALGLPADVPWDVAVSALWNRPTLLVLEDLGEHAVLLPVLQDVQGLVLLASLGPLFDPSLLKLLTSGWVTELGTRDLAFSLHEAESLIHDEERCKEALAMSQGWPLPLHFTALTGHVPERRALLEGIRASITLEEWREVLLLSSLSRLPGGAESEATASLAAAGFVQRLEDGFRLHPLAAETVLSAYAEEVRESVRAEGKRLPPLLRGEAYEVTGLWEELNALLENADVDLARYDAEAVIRWDKHVPFPRKTFRTHRVGHALCLLGKIDEGVKLILEDAASQGSLDRKLDLYKDAVWWLAERSRFEEALQLTETAEQFVGQADPEITGRFLNNSASIYFDVGDWEQAERGYARALEYFPSSGKNSQRYVAETNLGVVRWHRLGDLDGLVLTRQKALENNRCHNPQNVPGDLLQLGEMELFLGRREHALQRFCEAQGFAKANPYFALIADGQRALVEGDVAAFPALWDRSKGWDDPQVQGRVLASWLTCLRERHLLNEGLRISASHHSSWSDPQRALILHGLGRSAEALALLGDTPPNSWQMEERLSWHAAKYQITSEVTDLDTLLSLTLVGARILPGLIPLNTLPKDRPNLTLVYPLEEVLTSGWKEAIVLRLSELPTLELSLLGGFRVTRGGQNISLTGRHQEMLTLIALGVSKEVVGEAMWPETPTKKARNNLYVNLNALRKTLEPWGVSAYLDDFTLIRTQADLWELETALAAGDHKAVLKLYKGPLAPQLDLSIVEEARGYLHSRVVDLLLKASLNETTQGAETYLRRIVELDPLNEAALQELLGRLIGGGKRSEALRFFRSFVRRLEDEIGVSPNPSTMEVLDLFPRHWRDA